MEGKTPLKKCTLTVAFAKDVDPIVDWVNKPWTCKGSPEGMFKTFSIKEGDNGIEVILEFNAVEVVACDEGGNKRTLVIPAYEPGAEDA